MKKIFIIIACVLILVGCKVDESVNNRNTEIYFGKWEITDIYFSNVPSIWGEEDFDNILGERVIFSSDSVIFDNKTLTSPIYEERFLTDKELYEELLIDYGTLGMDNSKPNMLVSIFESNDQNEKKLWIDESKIYRFFIKNENTLIAENRNVYMLLSKVSQENNKIIEKSLFNHRESTQIEESVDLFLLDTDEIKSENMIELFDLTIDQIQEKCSEPYRIVDCGPDGSYTGLYIESSGINIVYSLDDYPIYIEFKKLDNIEVGQEVETVLKSFGKSEMDHIVYTSQDGVADTNEYELNYSIGGHLLSIISLDNKTINNIIFYDLKSSKYYLE